MEGDDPRGWIRYCVTVLWPGVAVFALCAWAASRTHGAARIGFEILVAVAWLTLAALGVIGYRKYLRRRYPIFRRR